MSPKQAIWIGQLWVNAPALALIIGLPYLTYLRFGASGMIGLGILVGLGVGWLWWGRNVVLWKLWAFSRVRNRQELEMRAEQGNLIWPQGSWFNRTEIWLPAERRRWLVLEWKILEGDDYSHLPEQMHYRFNKWDSIANLMAVLVILGMGCLGIFGTPLFSAGWWIGLGFIAFIVLEYFGIVNIDKQYNTRDLLLRVFNTDPQLSLSDQGIFIAQDGLGFLAWEQVLSIKPSDFFEKNAYIDLAFQQEGNKQRIRLLVHPLKASLPEIHAALLGYQQRWRG
jgi:hypothetical protein